MEWLDPWSAASKMPESVALTWAKQLAVEVAPGHALYGIPTRLLARRYDDDALYELLDGSGRVANVHLTWSKSMERLPWPGTDVYASLQEWTIEVMIPGHEEWSS